MPTESFNNETSQIQADGPKGTKLRATCDACQAAKSRCSRGKPCFRCMHQKVPCNYSPSKRIGRPRQKPVTDPTTPKNHNQLQNQGKGQGQNLNPSQNLQVEEVLPKESTFPVETNGDLVEIENISLLSGGNEYWHDDGQFSDVLDESATSLYLSPTSLDFQSMCFLDEHHGQEPGSGGIVSNVAQNESVDDLQQLQGKLDQSTTDVPDHDMIDLSSIGLVDDELRKVDYSDPSGLFDAHCHNRHPSAISQLDDNLFFAPISQQDDSQLSRCNCYRGVLRRLSEFDNNRSFSTIDSIIKLQKGTREQMTRMMKCTSCARNRPDLLLLLVIVMENIVCILETVSGSKLNYTVAASLTVGRLKPSRPSSPPHGLLIRNGSFRRSEKSQPNEDSLLQLMESCPLVVGDLVISADDKVDFMTQFLRRELSSLSAVLRQLQECLRQLSPHILSDTGFPLVRDLHRRLHLVIGRLELWGGRGAFR